MKEAFAALFGMVIAAPFLQKSLYGANGSDKQIAAVVAVLGLGALFLGIAHIMRIKVSNRAAKAAAVLGGALFVGGCVYINIYPVREAQPPPISNIIDENPDGVGPDNATQPSPSPSAGTSPQGPGHRGPGHEGAGPNSSKSGAPAMTTETPVPVKEPKRESWSPTGCVLQQSKGPGQVGYLSAGAVEGFRGVPGGWLKNGEYLMIPSGKSLGGSGDCDLPAGRYRVASVGNPQFHDKLEIRTFRLEK